MRKVPGNRVHWGNKNLPKAVIFMKKYKKVFPAKPMDYVG
jgi:hypothetical protein